PPADRRVVRPLSEGRAHTGVDRERRQLSRSRAGVETTESEKAADVRKLVMQTRRQILQSVAAAFVPAALGSRTARAFQTATPVIGPLSASVLPAGVRSRFVDGVNGLRVHVLEAGFETPGRPALVLLHGYPELAYSWRKVMGPLAAA